MSIIVCGLLFFVYMLISYLFSYIVIVGVVEAIPNPQVLAQDLFTLLPTCHFTWEQFFIGFGEQNGATRLPYSDAINLCGQFTSSGTVAQMVPAVPEATSIFPMAQLCIGTTSPINLWVSALAPSPSCTILIGSTPLIQSGTLQPVPCTNSYTAVLCYYPNETFIFGSVTTESTLQTTTRTTTNLIPSFTSTTITVLTTTPTTTTEIDIVVSQTQVFLTTTLTSVSSSTSMTSETTTIKSTLSLTDSETITTTFTYSQVSVTISVPTLTVTETTTTTETICDRLEDQ